MFIVECTTTVECRKWSFHDSTISDSAKRREVRRCHTLHGACVLRRHVTNARETLTEGATVPFRGNDTSSLFAFTRDFDYHDHKVEYIAKVNGRSANKASSVRCTRFSAFGSLTRLRRANTQRNAGVKERDLNSSSAEFNSAPIRREHSLFVADRDCIIYVHEYSCSHQNRKRHTTATVGTFCTLCYTEKREESDVQFCWRKRDGSKGTLIGVHLEKLYQRLKCLRVSTAPSRDVRNVGGSGGSTGRANYPAGKIPWRMPANGESRR